jgi:hypothetical protein
MVFRSPKISKIVIMIGKCILERGIIFQSNPNTEILERINIIKIKHVDQRFRLGKKPKKEDYKWAASVRRNKRMAKIKRRKPEEDLTIPPIRVSFLEVVYVMQPDKEMENLGQKLTTMDINTLKKDKIKVDNKRTKAGKKDEVLSQLTIHTLEEVSNKTLV